MKNFSTYLALLPKKIVEKCLKFPILKSVYTEYCALTTIHGIHFFADVKRTIVERISWLIAFVASLVMCTILILNILDKSERTPVIVTFADKSMPIFYVCIILIVNGLTYPNDQSMRKLHSSPIQIP